MKELKTEMQRSLATKEQQAFLGCSPMSFVFGSDKFSFRLVCLSTRDEFQIPETFFVEQKIFTIENLSDGKTFLRAKD